MSTLRFTVPDRRRVAAAPTKEKPLAPVDIMVRVSQQDLYVVRKTIRELVQLSEKLVDAKLAAEFRSMALQVQVTGYLGSYEDKMRSDMPTCFGVMLSEEIAGADAIPLNIPKALLDRDASLVPNAYVSAIGSIIWFRFEDQAFYVWRKRLREQQPMRFALLEAAAAAARLWA